jgi:hypothetical protein
MFEGKQIVCRDCLTVFTFTSGQQQFFRNRELAEPKRCEACRSARRRDRVGHAQSAFNGLKVPR